MKKRLDVQMVERGLAETRERAQALIMAGDVTVGLSGTTRMACPEAQMAVEDRFLKHLAGIKKFGFMIGQLALSYETDGGWGVLLFDAREAARSALPPR